MPLLRHLDAFYETHRRCGGLDDAVDGGRIWTTCSCGAVVGRTPGQRIVYLEIPEFPGYMIGSDGSVWSRRRASEWRRLRPGRSKSHYVAGGLRKWTGKKTAVHVHRLVLEAFVGPPPEGAVACHNNEMVTTIASQTSAGTQGRPTRPTPFATGCIPVSSQGCPRDSSALTPRGFLSRR